jgi:hypothetical protein
MANTTITMKLTPEEHRFIRECLQREFALLDNIQAHDSPKVVQELKKRTRMELTNMRELANNLIVSM